ncbi:unnamed protein product [Brassica napus]|uniref:(rape) hypothetical protein n=1 Tax=Brassica napus TaxID=3708 RepID=A0A816KCK5_BRANA|nr:unnamed protein product [Brassica napus]
MWKDFSNSRVKLLAVKAVMIAHPKAEWFWWIDSDESFIVMEFMASLHYRYQNLVVYGWPCITYVIQSWIVVNADVFHIGNCQWSMEVIDTGKSMGPASLEYAKWGSIQKTTSKDKLFPKSDDLIVHFGGIYGDNIERGTLEWNVVNDDKKGDGDTSNVWCYWFQSKRISMPWIITTKHVISCSGSVWDGLRCNRWIASNDLLREKRYLLIRIESHKKDLTRPRTKWRKASESAYPTNALGSIVLLLSLLKILINNMFDVIYDSCNMLH